MKIETFRQVCAGRTDRQTDRQSDSLGSLTEPKKEKKIVFVKQHHVFSLAGLPIFEFLWLSRMALTPPPLCEIFFNAVLDDSEAIQKKSKNVMEFSI